MIKRLFAFLATSGVAVLAFAVPASAATVYHDGSCRSSGDFAICIASGTAHHPTTMYVHASARPNQRLDVSWTMTCSRGLSAASKSGSFTARTPIRRLTPHPFRHPDSCTVAASGQLHDSGSIHVWNTYRRT